MIAIVPARAGSKGLPGKNTKLLNGRPLIEYTIVAAKKSAHVTEVIISTDDARIAEIAVKVGASCPFLRPPKLATDKAQAIDNYIYTIDRLSHERDMSIDEFMVLQPTSPLRTTTDIDRAVALFHDKEADSVISYVEERHPVTWHKYVDENNRFELIFPDDLSNRQELRKSYYPNGAVMIFKSDLIRKRSYYSENSFAYIMPAERSVDIDTLLDFEYAEFLLTK